ncbi:Acyl-CoA dehydrogenase, short-chain specific [bioreactor metagenome]|uniref:Acyl-CoA dehydrogenase, short-chain specific n=1 Tax=bioreactor metagenome TaxID=1076179 RepID=A0A644YBM3_9ZZZZ
MNFKFNEEEQSILDMLHDFCLKEVKPLAAEIDEQERFPMETWKKLGEMGMMGIAMPEEYGGAGLSYLTYIGACEEFARYCATTSVMFSAHGSLCCWPISQYGTEEQKKKYLTPLCTGEKLGAFGLTEPSAGSDAAMQKTVAEDKGDYYLINGSKVFITNGSYAETYVIFAMTDKTQGTKGISAFILEKGMPGFKFGTKEKKMGIRGSATYELIFEDVKVPKENLLGKVGEGFKIAMSTLDGGRIGIAAQALGIAEAAVDEAVSYTSQRVQFGKRISQFQYTQFELAEMKADVEAARLLIYRAAQAKQDHEPYGHLAAMGKLFASEVASDVSRRCLQMAGGCGFTREYPFERYMRDAKITEIYEGTSEVQRMVIAGWMGVK